MQISHLTPEELAGRTAGAAVTARGKELTRDATVGEARRLLASRSVQLAPLLDGHAYVGALTQDDLPAEARDDEPARPYARRRAPEASASTPLAEALARLDGTSRRVVVLADDGSTYHGLLCLSSDGRFLCVDAECHATAAHRNDRA